MSEKLITFRLDEHMKKAFEAVAKERDLTTSQMLRHYVRNVIEQHMKENAQRSLLEPIKNKTRGK